MGYFLLNRAKKYQGAKLFLVGMSLWFYACFHLSYLWIILCSIAVNYVCHLLLTRRFYVKWTTAAGIFLNLGILFYFKYFDFVLENINSLLHSNFTLTGVLLPLGISFFTFQQIAFLVDTAKGLAGRQNFPDYALFVTFFPQLIAGPIVSHEEMLPQFQDISQKRLSAENFYLGLRIFVLGLSKKVLLADTFGRAVNWGFEFYMVLDGLNTFLVALFFTLQLYFDFSGYCDMARGIGYMFNIRIPVNFLSPYKSANILEFWDRWHITLTRFFTKYVYIPLGGNRKGTLRTCLNVLLVFCISGIWHGAGWTFVVWGLLHGSLSVLTRLWHRIKQRLTDACLWTQVFYRKWVHFIIKGFCVFLTFLFLSASWVLFRADNLSQAGTMLKSMTSLHRTSLYVFFQVPEIWYVLKFLKLDTLPYATYYSMIIVTVLALLLIFFCRNLYEDEKICKPKILDGLWMSALSVWCVLSLSEVSTFLYFNF